MQECKQSDIDTILEQNPATRIINLIDVLPENPPRILSLIQEFLLPSIFQDASLQPPQFAPIFIRAIANIPNLAAQHLGRKTPKFFQSKVFFTNVTRQCFPHVLDYHSCLEMLIHLCAIGYSNIVAKAFRAHTLERERHSSLHTFTKTLIQRPGFEAFMDELIKQIAEWPEHSNNIPHAKRRKILPEFFSKLWGPKLRFLFCEKYITIRVLPIKCVEYILELISSVSNDFKIEMELLADVSQAWSQKSFIRHASKAHHFYLSRILLLLLRSARLGKHDFHEHGPILKGVHSRLVSDVDYIRKLGMLIGEEFGKGFALETPLEFGEDLSTLFEEEKVEADVKLVEDDCDVEEVKEPEILTNKVRTWDDFGSDSDSIEEWQEEDIPAYDHSKPHFLRTAWKALTQDQDSDKFTSALEHLESLIRDDPPDLPNLCAKLCRVLVHSSNPFAIENFGSLRAQCLKALVSTCPEKSAASLVSQIFSQNTNLREKLTCLEAMVQGAREMANLDIHLRQEEPKLSILTSRTAMDEYYLDSEETNQEKRWRIVDDRVKDKTRRWGSVPKKIQTRSNRFASVATQFFYPLLNLFLQNFQTLPHPELISRTLWVLGQFIECAQNIPEIIKFCNDLLELLWLTRTHDKNEVRAASLFCASRIVIILPPNLLVSGLSDNLPRLMAWLMETFEGEIYVPSRDLAMLSLQHLKKSGAFGNAIAV